MSNYRRQHDDIASTVLAKSNAPCASNRWIYAEEAEPRDLAVDEVMDLVSATFEPLHGCGVEGLREALLHDNALGREIRLAFGAPGSTIVAPSHR